MTKPTMDTETYVEPINGHYEFVFRRAFESKEEALRYEADTNKCGVIEFVEEIGRVG